MTHRQSSGPVSGRRSPPWSTSGGGCCSCSAPGGARAPSTSSPPGCCATRAPGRRCSISPLLALMRNQIEAAQRLGVARRRSTRATTTTGPRSPSGSRAGRDRPPAHLARAAGQRRVPRRGAAGHRRVGRACSSSTRPTASPTGATTSVPTTAASRGSSTPCPARCPGAGHHRHRQRPGGRRRRRASSATDLVTSSAGRSRRDGLQPARRRPAEPGRAAGVAGSRTLPAAARHRHRLLPHRRATPSGSPTGSQPTGDRRGRLQRRRPTLSRASPLEERAARERGQGARGHVRARAWASTSPTSASSSTSRRPARRSPTTSRSVGRGGPLASRFGILLRGREDEDIQDCFIDTAFPPEDRRRAVSDAARGGRVGPTTVAQIEAAVNLERGRLENAPEAARGRRRRRHVDGPGLGAHAAAVDLSDGERVEQVTAARADRAGADAPTTRPRRCLPDGVPARLLDDPDRGSVRRVRRLHRLAASKRRSTRPIVEAAIRFLRGRPLVIEPRRQLAGRRRRPCEAASTPTERLEPGRALCRCRRRRLGPASSRHGKHGGRPVRRRARRRGWPS